jgi:hypothetical protein
MEKQPKTVDLREIFLGLQTEMMASLSATKSVVHHPGAKGAGTELQWLNMLRSYLPERYAVNSAFVLDADGTLSEQIDIVIFDRQYSPFLFNKNFVTYVPAESVYAVLEVKPELNSDVVKYAGEKIASVRRLRRTSVPIPSAGGELQSKRPGPILGGSLVLNSGWKPAFGQPFVEHLASLPTDQRLDFGCALQDGSFSVAYKKRRVPSVTTSSPQTSLIAFFLGLVSRLRALGTVPALDLSVYGRVL